MEKDDSVEGKIKTITIFVRSIIFVLVVVYPVIGYLYCGWFKFNSTEKALREASEKRIAELDKDWERRKSEFEKRVTELEKTSGKRNDELSEYWNRRKGEFDTRIAELEKASDKRNAELNEDWNRRKSEFETRVAELEKEKKAKNDEVAEINRLTATLPQLQRDVNAASNELARVLGEQNSAVEKLREVRQQEAEWAAKVQAAKTYCDERKVEADRISAQINANASTTNDIALELAAWQGERKKMEVHMQELRLQTQTISNEMALAREALSREKEKLEQVKKEWKETDKQRADILARLREMTEIARESK